jgi:hypothetical protein
MAFSELMKDILGQGAAVSKDILSRAGEKAQDWGGKGLDASKEWANKAGAKVQEMGERGVLALEIKQLEGQAQKLLARLGNEVYGALAERGEPSVGADVPEIRGLLSELASVREAIEKREAELDSRKN